MMNKMICRMAASLVAVASAKAGTLDRSSMKHNAADRIRSNTDRFIAAAASFRIGGNA